ncbi:MAG TPA: MBL fold metallo-hydrolase [Gammaproteobacteria bacterium]|nr:MBL fold metallo-hydrolase [Gammaproteobacteria bacterium]
MKISTLLYNTLYAVTFCLGAINITHAKPLQDYVPVLDQVKNNAFQIDQKKGYLVKKVKPHVYVITDGIWQSAFITTGKGVILLDAPQSFGQHITQAVAETTDEPIKMLVYTHSHVDHIGGSQHLKNIPGLKIIAHQAVADFLKEKNDPRRLLPTQTYSGDHVINMGSETIHLDHHGNYHSTESDTFVYLPQRRFLMVIDSLAPGYVPFRDFDLTHNFHEYLKMFDAILDYDFDVFVGGHLTQIGTAKDVRTTQAYVQDVYQTVKRMHSQANQFEIMSAAAKKIGWDNKFALFNVFLEHIVEESAREIEARWIDKLAGVDVWAKSHARTALIYVRWDD